MYFFDIQKMNENSLVKKEDERNLGGEDGGSHRQ